ncbi:hypothetical protein ASF71_21130 [Deinococcus sp. Leaf326]|nr:hypothetical protein ASF71_21130 [Deinococcus sp. Leaf326]
MQTGPTVALQSRGRDGPEQLQGELGGGRLALPSLDLKSPREPQLPAAQVQHDQVDPPDAVGGMDPISEFSELAGLFQARQVHQQFQPGTRMG